VLTSDVSRTFPIPDAGLGAVAYMIGFLMGFMGDRRRWRTMPWMVTFFGILVVPLGVVSITLIILQPLAVGAWCTPCLIAAAGMLVMIPLTLDEVVAMGQFLVQARREGQPFWRTFWRGGTLRDLPVTGSVRPDVVSATAMVWEVALPWNLSLSVGLGVWLMRPVAAPRQTAGGRGAAWGPVGVITDASTERPLAMMPLPVRHPVVANVSDPRPRCCYATLTLVRHVECSYTPVQYQPKLKPNSSSSSGMPPTSTPLNAARFHTCGTYPGVSHSSPSMNSV
jgi:hypothetical protein